MEIIPLGAATFKVGRVNSLIHRWHTTSEVNFVSSFVQNGSVRYYITPPPPSSCLATRSSCRCISVLSTPSLNNMSTRIVSTHLLFTRKNSLRNATKCFSSIATIATYRSIFRNKPRFPYEEPPSEDIWWRFNLFPFPGTASGFTDQRGELIYSWINQSLRGFLRSFWSR